MSKKTSITLIILLVTACVLTSIALIVGGVFLLRAQKDYTQPTPIVETNPTSIPTPVTETTAPQPENEEPLSAEILNQMDEIQQQVMQIRGKELKHELQRDLMTPEELQDKIINEFFVDYTKEDVERDVKVLTTLGLLDYDFDLRQFYLDLYTEQVAGYYDSETKEMYVIAGKEFAGAERMTYAHEFNHVLQDQYYDLENGLKLNEDYCELDTEYCAAVTALVEGDSTLTEQYWFLQYSTRQDQQDIMEFQSSYSSPVYDSAPNFMKEDFLFPYIKGMEFVSYLYESGGWDAVDAAFLNPPVSTEQILHPEKYPSDKPVVVEMPDFSTILDRNWEEIDRNVMGEWYSYLILAKGRTSQFMMDEEDSAAAAAGWAGDTYVYYTPSDSNDYLFAWRSRWETGDDMNEFFNQSREYGLARWGTPSSNSSTVVSWESETEGSITMRRTDNDVLWLMSSSEADLQEALNLLQDFGN
jgi:hypothetical protein